VLQMQNTIRSVRAECALQMSQQQVRPAKGYLYPVCIYTYRYPFVATPLPVRYTQRVVYARRISSHRGVHGYMYGASHLTSQGQIAALERQLSSLQQCAGSLPPSLPPSSTPPTPQRVFSDGTHGPWSREFATTQWALSMQGKRENRSRLV
jgi:hypothetical protein